MRDSLQKIIDALTSYASTLAAQRDALQLEQNDREDEIADWDEDSGEDAPEEIDNSEEIAALDSDLNSIDEAIGAILSLSAMEQ